jgi:putative endonuclease
MNTGDKIFYVYILYSQIRDRYYVGSTDDIDRRFHEHNSGKSKSTRSGRPWKIMYTEVFTTLSSAVQRELEIKRKKRRSYLEFLINSHQKSNNEDPI